MYFLIFLVVVITRYRSGVDCVLHCVMYRLVPGTWYLVYLVPVLSNLLPGHPLVALRGGVPGPGEVRPELQHRAAHLGHSVGRWTGEKAQGTAASSGV